MILEGWGQLAGFRRRLLRRYQQALEEQPLVPRKGLEPLHLAAADFESAASTDSATSAEEGELSLNRCALTSLAGAYAASLRAGEGLGQGAGNQGAGVGVGSRRLLLEVGDDRPQETVLDIAVGGQAQRVQLDAHLAREKVGDSVAIGKPAT